MKKSVLLYLVIACITAQAGPAWAQIYRSTDANGNVIFTDTPPPGGEAEQVNLHRTNTAEPTPITQPTESSATGAEKSQDQAPTHTVVITSPANEDTIPIGAGGNFSVVARVEPDLKKGQSLRLSLDGTPTGKLMQSGFWDLETIDRGSHTLTVAIVSGNGTVLGESKPVTVHVMRASVNPGPG